MPVFRYNAVSVDGQPVTGDIQADDVKTAIDQILASGLKVESIHEVAPPSADAPPVDAGDDVLRRQLTRIVDNRVVIAPALQAYAAELPAGVERNRVRAMAERLEQAHLAADLAETCTPQWARLACASVGSVDPSHLICALSRQHQSVEATHQTLIRILSYPAMILFASCIAFGVFAFVVAPVFRDIFESFDASLPWLTSFVLRSAERITAVDWYWYLLAGLLIAAILWRLSSFRRSPGENRFAVVSTFAEALADLVEGQIAVPDAIRVASVTAVAPEFRESADQLAYQFENDRITNPIAGMPHTLVHALTCTNESTAMANVLRELATIYRAMHARRTRWMLTLLEPLAIVFVGMITGLVFIAIMAPLISLVSNLS